MVKRPIMRYHGGKWRLAPWIIGFFPEHRVYVEPYGGAASVLFQKPQSFAEIYNDLDKEIFNVFDVLRNERAGKRLIRQLTLTPYHRDEFRMSYKKAKDRVEQARRTIVRAMQGFSSDSATRQRFTGFRSTNMASGRFGAEDWAYHSEALWAWILRMRTVCFENDDAFKVIQKYDGPDTLIYCDPPYVKATRHKGEKSEAYNYEMSDDDHRELAKRLHSAKGFVLVSGYDSTLYSDLYSDWHKERKTCVGQARRGGRTNIECLWINPKTMAAQKMRSLFA